MAGAPMEFIPYATQSITEDDLAAVREVLTSGWLTQGPAVPRFEQAFAALHGGSVMGLEAIPDSALAPLAPDLTGGDDDYSDRLKSLTEG